jgi:heat-inducible transcriptional repressor
MDAVPPTYTGSPASLVRSVLGTLEQQYVVVSLLRDVLDRGLSVAIGNEHGVEPLAACSVVVAPVTVEGENLGTIGVLGPTRMNYPQALAAVEVVSDRLGRRLAET